MPTCADGDGDGRKYDTSEEFTGETLENMEENNSKAYGNISECRKTTGIDAVSNEREKEKQDS